VALDRARLLGRDRSFAVDGLAQGVDDPPDQGLPDGHLRDAAGALDDVALADQAIVTEEHGADVVLFEAQDHADDVVREVQQLPRHRLLEAVDAGDAVAHLDHPADLGEIHLGLEPLDLAPDDLADLARLDHADPLESWMIRSRMARSCPLTLMSSNRLPTSATKPPTSVG